MILLNKIENFGSGCAMGCPTCRTPNDSITQERGVTRLPALVIDGEVRFQGKALSVEEIKSILSEIHQKDSPPIGGEE